MPSPKDSFPLIDTRDMEILMHRNAHFGGNFDVMIEYYEQDGVGKMPDFALDEITKLKAIANSNEPEMADALLPEGAQEEISKAHKLYHALRDAYNKDEGIPQKISDLILSEETYPDNIIEQIAGKGHDAITPLLHIIETAHFYDPLYPGYGRSPLFAADCLGKIGSRDAIKPLFEALGQDNFFFDEAFIKALTLIGSEAKSFLLKQLKQKPFSKTNENAAIALLAFGEDAGIATTALKLLQDPDIKSHTVLINYLISACFPLEEAAERKTFTSLIPTFPPQLQNEAQLIVNYWK